MGAGARSVPEIGEIKRACELGFNHKQRRRQFVWAACPGCQKERWVAKGEHPRNCRVCYCARHRDYQLENHPNWKGGRRISNGYCDIKIPLDDVFYSMVDTNGYIREHRYVMARHLGRCLEAWEIVHHLNGIRDDNRIINLVLTQHDKHEYHTLLKRAQLRIRELETIIKLDGAGKKRVRVEI